MWEGLFASTDFNQSSLPSNLPFPQCRSSLPLWSPQDHPTRFYRLALHCGYHLLFNSPDSKGGVGLLISSQITPSPPPLTVIVPGRLIQVEVQPNPAPGFPPTSLCAFYGSNLRPERSSFAPHLQSLLAGNAVLMGDFNATTQSTDASTLSSNHWIQLRAWEVAGQLLDSVRMLTPTPPYTRTRRYGGTQSYLDRIYFTQIAAQFLIPDPCFLLCTRHVQLPRIFRP